MTNRQVTAIGQVEKFLVNARCKRPATAASSASWNGGGRRDVGCFWSSSLMGPAVSTSVFWVVELAVWYVSEKRKLVRTPLKPTTSFAEIHRFLKKCLGFSCFFAGARNLIDWMASVAKKSMDTLNGPLPGFRRPQGWHDIFSFSRGFQATPPFATVTGRGSHPMDT